MTASLHVNDPTTPAKRRLFVGYSSDDAADAAMLARGLEAAGADVWCDLLGRIPPGVSFVHELEKAIEAADAYILFLTPASMKSFWVEQELHYAMRWASRRRSMRIVPLTVPEIEQSQLAGFLGNFEAERLDLVAVRRQDGAYFRGLRSRLELAGRPTPEDVATVCPYRGLEVIDDPKLFFGRDEELAELGSRFQQDLPRWISFEGSSGVGKSSLVRAGVVPLVRRLLAQRSTTMWPTITLRPGRDPIQSLATAIVQSDDLHPHVNGRGRTLQTFEEIRQALSRDDGLVSVLTQNLAQGVGCIIVVDQLEELVTLADGDPLRDDRVRQFEARMGEAIVSSGVPLIVLTTVRSDVSVPMVRDARLATFKTIEQCQPMTVAGLRDAIRGPAALANLDLPDGLVDLIVNDAQELDAKPSSGRWLRPAALPLVAHLLRALWERREGRTLTVAAYSALSGVGGALSSAADAVRRELDDDDLAAVLLQMVSLRRREAPARRCATRDDFLRALRVMDNETVPPPQARVDAVLQRLTGGPHRAQAVEATLPRLVVAGGGTFELVHDALLFRWNWLRERIMERRHEKVRETDLADALADWEDSGCEPAWLPRGGRLQYLKGVRQPNDEEKAMLAVAQRAERRWPIEVKATIVGLVCIAVMVAMVVSLTLMKQENEESDKRAKHAHDIARDAARFCPTFGVVEVEGEYLCVTARDAATERLRLCILRVDTYCREHPVQGSESACRRAELRARCAEPGHPIGNKEGTEAAMQTCLDQCSALHPQGDAPRDRCVGQCFLPPGDAQRPTSRDSGAPSVSAVAGAVVAVPGMTVTRLSEGHYRVRIAPFYRVTFAADFSGGAGPASVDVKTGSSVMCHFAKDFPASVCNVGPAEDEIAVDVEGPGGACAVPHLTVGAGVATLGFEDQVDGDCNEPVVTATAVSLR